MEIPAQLKWIARQTGGPDWLAALPERLRRAADRWNLSVAGEPFSGGTVSYAIPVTRGTEHFVLKLQWPHPEAEHEAAALRAWGGNGGVRLIDHDPADHALLLERCRPGTFLADAGVDDPIDAILDLLPRLWVETDEPFPTLVDEAARWRVNLPVTWERAGRPCERALVDAALAFIDDLAGTQALAVLTHQDLHGHNILSAERAPWLAIDPKPLLAEPAFALAPVIRSFEFGHTAEATVGRLDRLSAALDLNRDRALGWTVAQTMAWGFDGVYDRQHHQTVRWLLDAR